MRIRNSLAALLLMLSVPAFALTSAQISTLKAACSAAPACQSLATAADDVGLAAWFNATDATYTVWKSNVSIGAIGDKINGTEMAGLSSLNATRLQTVVMLSASGINPSLADRRQFFDDIFSGSGGVNTRAALLALYKRNPTRAEKALATGTGTDAVPATLTFEGAITFADASLIRS